MCKDDLSLHFCSMNDLNPIRRRWLLLLGGLGSMFGVFYSFFCPFIHDSESDYLYAFLLSAWLKSMYFGVVYFCFVLLSLSMTPSFLFNIKRSLTSTQTFINCLFTKNCIPNLFKHQRSIRSSVEKNHCKTYL